MAGPNDERGNVLQGNGRPWRQDPAHGGHAGFVRACASASSTLSRSACHRLIVGGDAIVDACSAQGKVVGLDPRGDNFLSLRGGPGGKPYRELASLGGGQIVAICQERGMWLGVVYLPRGGTQDCGVATAIARARPYRGPCRSGWSTSVT